MKARAPMPTSGTPQGSSKPRPLAGEPRGLPDPPREKNKLGAWCIAVLLLATLVGAAFGAFVADAAAAPTSPLEASPLDASPLDASPPPTVPFGDDVPPAGAPMEIVKVSDGDTFKVRRVPSLEGSSSESASSESASSESASSESASSNTPVYTLRLIGIDTPEKYMSSKLRRDAERSGRDVETIQALGRAATDYAKQLLTGPDGNYQRVTLSYDKANAAKGHRGRYGRVIAYVWILNRQGERGFMVNRRLVADGYAYAYTSFPFTHADEFVALQRQAIEAGRGLWGDSAASTGPTGQKAAGQKAAGQKAAGQKAAGQNTSQKTTNQAPRRTQEAPTSPPPLRYDPSGPDRDCSDFATEAEAQRFFEAAAPGDPHRLDRDGNGRACESLEL